MNSKVRELVKDTFIFAIGNIGSKIILFFLVPLYTAYMTKSQYGTADLIFTVAQLVLPFVSIVIYDALIRFGLSKDAHPEDVLLVAFLVLGAGAAATVVLTPFFSLYPPISPWKWQLSAYIILSGFHSASMNYLKVKGRNIRYAGIGLLHTALMAVLSIILLAGRHMGVAGFLAASIASMFLSTMLAIIAGDILPDLRKARFRAELFSEMVRYSAPLILNNISWWVVHSSDKVMIERMLDTDSLGLYTVSAKIPALINVLINIFSQGWGISSVKEFENSNDAKFYSSVLEVYIFICFGASIALIAVTKPFMRLYVSAAFYDSWRYVPILLASAAFASIAYYYGSLYGALKKSGRNMGTTCLAAAVNILVNYVGIRLTGVYGAAIGTLVAYIVMALVRMVDVGRFIPLFINRKRFAVICVLILLQASLITLDFHSFVISLIAIVVFVVLYHNMIVETAERLIGFLRKR